VGFEFSFFFFFLDEIGRSSSISFLFSSCSPNIRVWWNREIRRFLLRAHVSLSFHLVDAQLL
jgi:hypothetical protein